MIRYPIEGNPGAHEDQQIEPREMTVTTTTQAMEYDTTASLFFSEFRMTCRSHRCTDTHFHTHDDEEDDPCFQQEVAAAEKARARYAMLKKQSDRLLMNLNIRTEKLRPRSAVRNTEEEHDHNTDSDSELKPVVGIRECEPNDLTAMSRAHPESTLFVLCRPCDQSIEDTLVAEFESATSSIDVPEYAHVVFVKFKRPMCVCGKCEGTESRIAGPLRSVGMLLRTTSSVVALRKGGLVGMWQGTSSGPLPQFIRKYI